MAKNDTNRVKLIFPRLPTAFVWLNKPNTKWNANGKYECTVIADPSDEAIAAIVEKMTAVRDEAYETKLAELNEATKGKDKAKAKVALKKLHKADIGAPELDDEAEETGNLKFKASSVASGKSKKDGKPWKRKPTLFDAKGKKLDNPPLIFGGSEVKMAVTAAPYYKPDDGSVGCTLYLDAVQVIKLVSGTGQSADDFGFGEEEGFEAEEAETFPEGSEGGTEGDDDKDEF